jgi:uncharacterized protein with HEPN domain
MTKDWRIYVEDILDAMDKAEVLLAGMSYDGFEADWRIQFAVTRALEIVGEATKRLPMSIRDQYPHIPWKDMAGMRDIIIHSYDNVNLQVVWTVVIQDIPQIKPQLQQILADYKDA